MVNNLCYCNSHYCKECIKVYIEMIIESSIIGVIPMIKCIALDCPGNLQFSRWRSFISYEYTEKALKSARECLSIDCCGCDQRVSFLVESTFTSYSQMIEIYKFWKFIGEL